MDETAVIFPGQGVQRVGMARDFYEASASARAAFAEACDALGLDLTALCFEQDDRLALTEYAQPAILTAEIAMLRVAEQEMGFAPSRFGGHSLGEYTALVAAGVLPLAVAVRLVRERGRLMQEAVAVGQGGMRAIVQPDVDVKRLEQALDGLTVDVANVNCPDQVVLSGREGDLDVAVERIRSLDGYGRARAIALRVSAPFHCRLMKPAEDAFRPQLEAVADSLLTAAAGSVTCNFTGDYHAADAMLVIDRLARQISAPVQWLSNMRALAAACNRIVELGPGKPLRAFFAKLAEAKVAVVSVTDLEAARSAFTAVP